MQGTYDPLLGIRGKKETAEEAAKRLRSESAAVRDATVYVAPFWNLPASLEDPQHHSWQLGLMHMCT